MSVDVSSIHYMLIAVEYVRPYTPKYFARIGAFNPRNHFKVPLAGNAQRGTTLKSIHERTHAHTPSRTSAHAPTHTPAPTHARTHTHKHTLTVARRRTTAFVSWHEATDWLFTFGVVDQSRVADTWASRLTVGLIRIFNAFFQPY